MRNILGDNLTITLFGESHGEVVGAVLDGVAPGILVDHDFIKAQLTKRRPTKKIETARVEADEYKIVSGVFNGYTTGAPLTIIIPNTNTNSKDYEKNKNLARPSHADYVAHVKYDGYNDYRGGGHFSGRITAAIVAAGAIIQKALMDKGIFIGTHILKCGNVVDSCFNDCLEEVKILQNKNFPVINDVESLMREEIENYAINHNSIGGILQTAVVGMPVGVGEEWFSSVEGKIANACFSIGGIKGIEFGKGFGFAELSGKDANDSFYFENETVKTSTNHNGGINGGLTNGMPIIFNCAVKPTPSIGLPQKTIDFEKMENVEIQINGRHDPAIIRRMAVVVDTLTAIVIADLLTIRFGRDYLKK